MTDLDREDFFAFTDDRSVEAVLDWVMAVKFSEAERRQAARVPITRTGGQVPIDQYEASRPMSGAEARQELTATEEWEAWIREVAVNNELD